MTLAEILASVFPGGHGVRVVDGIVTGHGTFPHAPSGRLHVVGVDGGTMLGIDGALVLARAVLDAARVDDGAPILVAVDSGSQRMSLRDEMLGLYEGLAHLAKSLLLADRLGHPTVGLLHGRSAAGAFIATALATRVLAALPGAVPSVMDLASMARVTKIPLPRLEALAATTPVFAPGLANMLATGAVHVTLDPEQPLDAQVRSLIEAAAGPDERDRLGEERGGRALARQVAARVVAQAIEGARG